MLKKDEALCVSGIGLRPGVSFGRKVGIDVDGLLASYNLTEAELLDPNTRVPRHLVIENTNKQANILGDPEIGLRAAEHFKLTNFDIVGYIMKNCSHLSQRLRSSFTILGY